MVCTQIIRKKCVGDIKNIFRLIKAIPKEAINNRYKIVCCMAGTAPRKEPIT